MSSYKYIDLYTLLEMTLYWNLFFLIIPNHIFKCYRLVLKNKPYYSWVFEMILEQFTSISICWFENWHICWVEPIYEKLTLRQICAASKMAIKLFDLNSEYGTIRRWCLVTLSLVDIAAIIYSILQEYYSFIYFSHYSFWAKYRKTFVAIFKKK